MDTYVPLFQTASVLFAAILWCTSTTATRLARSLQLWKISASPRNPISRYPTIRLFCAQFGLIISFLNLRPVSRSSRTRRRTRSCWLLTCRFALLLAALWRPISAGSRPQKNASKLFVRRSPFVKSLSRLSMLLCDIFDIFVFFCLCDSLPLETLGKA